MQDVLCHVTEEPQEHAPRPCTADHYSPHGFLRDNLTSKSKFYFAQMIVAGKSTSALGAEPPLLSYTVVEEWEGLGPTYWLTWYWTKWWEVNSFLFFLLYLLFTEAENSGLTFIYWVMIIFEVVMLKVYASDLIESSIVYNIEQYILTSNFGGSSYPVLIDRGEFFPCLWNLILTVCFTYYELLQWLFWSSKIWFFTQVDRCEIATV